MKMKLLPVAVAAALALPGAAIAGGPTVFGSLNVTGENVDVDTGPANSDRWEVRSNVSSIGVKGDARINRMLSARYSAEWIVSMDGDGEDLAAYERFVGLAGDFGALDVGAFYTPTHNAQGGVDRFDDLEGDIGRVLVGQVMADDIVQYTTPEMGGVTARLAIIPGEQFDVGQNDAKDGLADGKSASVAFSNKTVTIAAGADRDISTTAAVGTSLSTADGIDLSASQTWDTQRVSAEFAVGTVNVGALYQQAKVSDKRGALGDIEQTGYVVSAAMPLTKQLTAKAQYTAATNENNTTRREDDVEMMGVGLDQALSKQTTVFTFVNMLAFDDEGAADEQTKDVFAVGIKHDF